MTVDTLPPSGALALPASETTRSLVEWAGELDAAHRIAKALCTTSFVPAAWRNKADQGAAAILYGAALNLPPTTALQIFYEINGRIGIYADAKVALVKGAGHDVWTEHRSNDSVTVCGQRKGSVRVESITITLADAKTAGWTTNANYAKTPADMLYHRAADRICKAIAPEVLYGIPVVDELVDLPPIQADAVVSRPTIASLTAVVPDAKPVVDIGDAPLAITPEQSKTLHGLARSQNRNTKAKLGPLIREVTGRDVADTGELTADEAEAVIARLVADGERAEEPAAEEQPELEP